MGASTSSTAAVSILTSLFESLPGGFRARLWDGTEVHAGSSSPPCTFVFRDRATFRKLLLRPRTIGFAEAYFDGRLDVEGDLFSAVRMGMAIQNLRPSLRERVRILWRLLRV